MSKHEKRNQLYTKAIILVWVGCIFFTMVFGFVALLKLGQAGNIEDAIIYTQNLNLSSSNAEGTRKPLNNPNDFVEDCIISTGDTHHIYDRVSVQSAALKFYEVTGCQMYYIHFDLEDTDIMSEAEGEAYIKAEIPKYIDDEYSLIIYSSDGKHTGEIDKYGYEEYVYVDSGIIYGKQTRELFNADTRTIVGDIRIIMKTILVWKK